MTENTQKPKIETDDFESFKDGALFASNYLKKNTLYVINYSKKPKQVKENGTWQDKTFTVQEGGKSHRTQYIAEVIDTKTGIPSEVTLSEKIYMDIIAQHDAFVKIVAKNPRLTLFPYVKAVNGTA